MFHHKNKTYLQYVFIIKIKLIYNNKNQNKTCERITRLRQKNTCKDGPNKKYIRVITDFNYGDDFLAIITIYFRV